ncbi:MAG: hypothetical protein HDQ91_05910 [Desulfovibrio sp.]|nr:hypothetical protein [Desulfovibrio sp.]
MSPKNVSTHLFDKLGPFLAAAPEFSHLASALPALQFSFSGSTLQVAFTHPYFFPFFNQHLRNDFEKACCLCAGRQLNFQYNPSKTPKAAPLQFPDREEPDPFDSFLCSPRNLAALKCARELCAASEAGLHLVIFHGAPASGKSRLLSTLAAALRAFEKQKEIMNCRAEALATHLPPEQFWQETRALILDDLHDMAGHVSLQKLLAILIDYASSSSFPAKIVLSLPSRDTGIFNARLHHRLEQGLFMELYPADFTLRLTFAEKRAAELGLRLSKTQLLGIARHSRSIPSIAGVLQKLNFYVNLQDQFPDENMLEKLAAPEAGEPAWQQSLLRVAAKMGIRPADITGKSRRQEFVIARQAAMYICRLKFGLSYPELGRIFGGRDHATVMHGIKKIQQLRQSDKVLHNLLTELEQEE